MNQCNLNIPNNYCFYLLIRKIINYEPSILISCISKLIKCNEFRLVKVIKKYHNITNLINVIIKLRYFFNYNTLRGFNTLDIILILEQLYIVLKHKKKVGGHIYIKDISIKKHIENCVCVLNDYDRFGNNYYENPIYDELDVCFIEIIIFTNYKNLTYKLIYNPRLKYFYYNHIDQTPKYIIDKIVEINKYLDLFYNNWEGLNVFEPKSKKQKLLNKIKTCTELFLEENNYY